MTNIKKDNTSCGSKKDEERLRKVNDERRKIRRQQIITMDASDMCFNNICTKEGLECCKECKLAWYCSDKCQEDHWRGHKNCCKMISSSPTMFLRYFNAVKNYKIGFNQRESEKFDQSLLSLQEALEVFKELRDDEYISICYFEIGRVLRSKSQYEEALVNYRKALEVYREILGENHGRTCDCYEAIGQVLSDQGRYNDAFIGYGKALAIRMKIFGGNHIGTGESYYDVGVVQLRKDDFDGALISLQKAKAIYTRALGVKHPKTVQTNASIALC